MNDESDLDDGNWNHYLVGQFLDGTMSSTLSNSRARKVWKYSLNSVKQVGGVHTGCHMHTAKSTLIVVKIFKSLAQIDALNLNHILQNPVRKHTNPHSSNALQSSKSKFEVIFQHIS